MVPNLEVRIRLVATVDCGVVIWKCGNCGCDLKASESKVKPLFGACVFPKFKGSLLSEGTVNTVKGVEISKSLNCFGFRMVSKSGNLFRGAVDPKSGVKMLSERSVKFFEGAVGILKVASVVDVFKEVWKLE